MSTFGIDEHTTDFNEEDILWISIVFLEAALLFSLPYIAGALLTPPGEQFQGLLRLSDDLLIYLSWIEQVKEGHILFVNLYTPLKQQYPFFSFFTLFLGGASKLFNITPYKMLFISRYIFAFFLIYVLYRFLMLIFPGDKKMRKIGLIIIVFSSGLGWLTGGYSPARGIQNSIDLWQPEATVFFTLYVNPLHAFSLIFIVLCFLSLLKWKHKKGGIVAGICLLVLANAHTYDLIIIGSVWTLYLIGIWVKNKKLPLQDIKNTFIALLIATPGICYQLFILFKDPVFSKRAMAPLPSPSFIWYITGMGCLIPLSVWAIIKRIKEKRVDDMVLFLSIWGISGFFLPRLPLPFQYKLFMGTQIPLAILSTIAISSLITPKRIFYLFIIVFLLSLSNVVILGNRIYAIIVNGPGNLSHWELEALNWLKVNTSEGDVILAHPNFATCIPAFSGRRVYAGHFVETPDYIARLVEVLRFYLAKDWSFQMNFLKSHVEIKYIYYGKYERLLFPQFLSIAEKHLFLAFQNPEVKIWQTEKKKRP